MDSFLRKKEYWEKPQKLAFMKNGAILLEKLIASSDGKYNPIQSFSAKEMKRATNNYDAQKVIKTDSLYALYKGFLQDRPVSVMKFKADQGYVNEESFNNIVFASQMCQKNAMKLIGCCLETQLPIIVFESIEYGTLADHIYSPRKSGFEPLLLKHRLKIAMEIANVVTYLHIGFTRPIVFRAIKPSNILFDEESVAKLFDFSLCMSIPEGETYIKDKVRGTPGLFAPEYIGTGVLNEKSDVFSFGVFLFVLLTGQRIADPARREAGDQYFLLDHVRKYNERNKFDEIIDPIIVGVDQSCQEKQKQLQDFKDLACKCVSVSIDNRPTMIDVAKKLRQIYRSG
ncbi:hypothetical protein LWI28_001580 [Acer negundo]|uniref:Protein kinase domain-containing protein n=1 Tax=Acer negundo TaxID=4023 RepID=A0AAD5J352_ACENE|nr:hypothetical protein LWI28_001580 [Acer negundo]